MKRRTKYTDEPVGTLNVVKDPLPTPDQLVLRENNIKVTISLSKSSIEFFKAKAKENRTPYQKMIRNLLDYYAARSHAPKSRTSGSRVQRARRQV